MKVRLWQIRFMLALFGMFLLGAVTYSANLENLGTNPSNMHSWWCITAAEVRTAFSLGEQAKCQGKSILDLGFSTPRGQSKILGQDLELCAVSLETPANELAQLGWIAEHTKDSQSSREETLKLALPKVAQEVEFMVYLTSENRLSELKSVTFAAETDKGVLLQPLPKASPSVSVGSTDLSSWFNCHHHPEFKLTDEKGRIAVTPQTKWLRLWIITSLNRVSVTFWLDNSFKVETKIEQ